MEKPEIIEQKIKELNKFLIQSKNHYQYEFICNSNFSEEMIGFFNIGNAKKILTLLKEHKILQYRHSFYGNYIVHMNQNGNRILVKHEDGTELETLPCNEFENCSTVLVYKSPINEDTIMDFIIWKTGEWYLDINS